MKHLVKLLIALRLFDENQTLSLTSLLMMVLVSKIALAPTLDWTVTCTLLLTLVSYNLKKLSAHNKAKHDASVAKIADTDKQRLNIIEQELKNINNALNFKQMGR